MQHDPNDLALARRLADVADTITMSRFRSHDLIVESKPDLTPVSDADRAVEDDLRAILAAECPGDAVIGEERGETGQSTRQWIIDPIDGTRNYVRGVPVWATLIALVVDGEVTVGIVSAPALGHRWWAQVGSGAWRSVGGGAPEAIRVSAVTELSDAFLSYSSIHGWAHLDGGAAFNTLVDTVWYSRAYGDFWSYMLVAEGAVDIACEPELALHDMAALVPIVREAGGVFTAIDGTQGPWGTNALAANPVLHAKARALLGSR
ncbi:histidinol-phosphatase [Schaalia suimastitidis]|uniref:histidinol-phosphatase n=1 Tax=Schaalia suimastitidis TaxID=121163 RepID=UPI0003FBA87C|nr:histidinol-phosphatase [Schaalia suimastitidis]